MLAILQNIKTRTSTNIGLASTIKDYRYIGRETILETQQQRWMANRSDHVKRLLMNIKLMQQFPSC